MNAAELGARKTAILGPLTREEIAEATDWNVQYVGFSGPLADRGPDANKYSVLIIAHGVGAFRGCKFNLKRGGTMLVSGVVASQNYIEAIFTP